MVDFNKLLAQVKDKGPNQSVVQKGGGFELPPEGTALARLVSYIELGQHEEEFKGERKTPFKVMLTFELHGKKYPPREIDGKKVPQRLSLELAISQNEKAKYFQILSRCRDEGDTHMLQLVGRGFLLDIVHREGKGDKKYANIDKDSVRKPIVQVVDAEGEVTKQVIEVPPMLGEKLAFVWDFATTEMWDSIYIPGEYEERKDEKTGEVIAPAKSKNVFQDKIREALNFQSLPVYDYAAGKTDAAGTNALADAVGDVETVTREGTTDDGDLMSGIG